jgi:hypothetical protein
MTPQGEKWTRDNEPASNGASALPSALWSHPRSPGLGGRHRDNRREPRVERRHDPQLDAKGARQAFALSKPDRHSLAARSILSPIRRRGSWEHEREFPLSASLVPDPPTAARAAPTQALEISRCVRQSDSKLAEPGHFFVVATRDYDSWREQPTSPVMGTGGQPVSDATLKRSSQAQDRF